MAGPTPRHLPGTEDASIVETFYFRQVSAAVEQMTSLRKPKPVVVQGIPGLGKSFSVHLATSALAIPTYWLEMPNHPKGKETISRIYHKLIGRMPPARTSGYVLLEEVLDALRGRDCVIVIDEVQNLNQESLRELRYLDDDLDTDFLLVLAGCNVRHHLKQYCPELDNRVGRCVSFEPFSGPEMREVLDVYHPLFANTDTDVLLTLYESLGGNFRNWANVLEGALTLGADAQVGIADRVARATLRAVFGPKAVPKAKAKTRKAA